uniref:Uncharacterized protein n=1 Tax=Solanum tuberosum TaxID=4113 RepID=M1DC79_SOLTU
MAIVSPNTPVCQALKEKIKSAIERSSRVWRQGLRSMPWPQDHDLHHDSWSSPRTVGGLVVMPWPLGRLARLRRLLPQLHEQDHGSWSSPRLVE